MTMTPGEIECAFCHKTSSDQSKWVVRKQDETPDGSGPELTFCSPEHANEWERNGGRGL